MFKYTKHNMKTCSNAKSGRKIPKKTRKFKPSETITILAIVVVLHILLLYSTKTNCSYFCYRSDLNP